MWHKDFAARLSSWNQLRDSCQHLVAISALQRINAWWFQTPWRPYYLHWDDSDTWPDPWQLLSDDVYCEVARALGILYTISLLERADLADVCLVLTDSGHNLVLVNKGKYILNWTVDDIVNTSQAVKIRRHYQLQPIK